MSSPDCITWMTIGLVESVAIVTLNLCTIIVFIRNCNLRKRSTYLVINLAVIDTLAGGVAVYALFYWFGVICEVWRGHLNVGLQGYIVENLLVFFPGMSIFNISLIALERAYATFRPLRHRLLKKWVYGLLIACGWVGPGLPIITLELLKTTGARNRYPKIAGILFCLLTICVSYSSIAIKVRCGGQPQHHGAASRERKLTMTLLIVNIASLLLCLPVVVFYILLDDGPFELSVSASSHLYGAVQALLYANPLVNPIIYAIRIPGYRSAVAALFCKKPALRNGNRRVVDLPLRDL
ncbi:uncharacterized protein LOC110063612 [Orbicella faveolata]|uniref:uncharacterized protein LOC110063612 n=1 Tax=Orbicella faveolata TaxID=48498 RepID=UPI0009E1CC41|nr:uncharacterized protein LOC110063612 [Orbicella faveolata]